MRITQDKKSETFTKLEICEHALSLPSPPHHPNDNSEKPTFV